MFYCLLSGGFLHSIYSELKHFRKVLIMLEKYVLSTNKSVLWFWKWCYANTRNGQILSLCVTSARRKDVRLTKEQESRLPSHWLKSKGAHKTMADALWRLRDLMLRDTLNIQQTYNIQNLWSIPPHSHPTRWAVLSVLMLWSNNVLFRVL